MNKIRIEDDIDDYLRRLNEISDGTELEITKVENKVLKILYRYSTFELNDIKNTFLECGKSYDVTIKIMDMAKILNKSLDDMVNSMKQKLKN